jgi:hypothetical protein
MNLSDGADENYRIGWLNVNNFQNECSDIFIDWTTPTKLPLQSKTINGTPFTIFENQIEQIHTNTDLIGGNISNTSMGFLLKILKINGELDMELPYSSIRNLNNESGGNITIYSRRLTYAIQHFWNFNSINYKFEIVSCQLINEQSNTLQNRGGMIIKLRKVETTARERSLARTNLANFGIFNNFENEQSSRKIKKWI